MQVEASDCEVLRERLLQTKRQGTFSDAAEAFHAFQDGCALRHRPGPGSLLLWSNKACMTGNHLLSLVSSDSQLQMQDYCL